MIPSYQELIRISVSRAGIDDRLAAALAAGDDLAAGRILREAASAELDEWVQMRAEEAEAARDEVSDDELAAAFRDVYRSEFADRQRDDAREAWGEMTADMRAHEAGE